MRPLFRVAAFAGLLAFAPACPARAADTPQPLPHYDLNIRLDTVAHRANVHLLITWTNPAHRATSELILNFYPHYRIPEGDYLLLAKTLELLRLNPRYGIDRQGRHGTVNSIRFMGKNGRPATGTPVLQYHYRQDNSTGIVAELPEEVGPGESVTVELDCTVCLPNKQGRWGHWQGITYLANAIPVVAYFDDVGWHSMPFVPWHQPFWNEAGHYHAVIQLPAAEKLACSAAVKSEQLLPDGWREVVTEPFIGRDFALVCSREFIERQATAKLTGGREVVVKCLAYPRHEFYAKEIACMVAEAIPVYDQWFGAYPYSQLTVVESFFGWNGNECAGLLMIDERVFAMPHLGRGYVEYLVSHETCHQWWYNLIGTNGYAETFMDEGAATYFTHRFLDRKHGPNNEMLRWPDGLEWLPNIKRENYRYGSMYGAIRRGEMRPAAGDLPGFNHLVGLFTGAYDRGSKVFGMIEARLGEAAFIDFIQGLVRKYSWGVLTASRLRMELEAYTGQSWAEFFERWVYGKGMTDWEVASVSVANSEPGLPRQGSMSGPIGANRVSILVRQNGEYSEPTTVGLRFAGQDGYPVRIPVVPTAGPIRFSLPDGRDPSRREIEYSVEPAPGGAVRVEFTTSRELEQVKIDPDNLLLDSNPGNNVWKPTPRFSIAPVWSMLNETDLTNDYDRWNFGGGPWIGGALYPDPWYTRSTMIGLRADAYRTQVFNGGVYTAIRTDYWDWIVGADALWDHYPFEKTQLGLNVEQRLAGPFGGLSGQDTATRASGFARYVFQYGSSLYLPPIHYVEAFTTYSDNFLPFARTETPGAERPTSTWMTGLHYRLNLYTPYWDPECGVWVDLTYGAGVANLGSETGMNQVRGELALVKKLPDWQVLGPLSNARLAVRGVAMGATPDRGEFFALGGGTLFRGFDLAERQGSALWVANAELRIPLARDVEWDALDHVGGVRSVWLATFYDVGEVYANGHSVGGVAHALGAGIRVDLSVFSFIERATLRFDVAKTINAATPFQFWFGVQHPF
jgi:hypothetical protein